MTSLFVTIVALVLFGIISLVSITYIDLDNAKAATQASVVATAMTNMVESAAMYRNANDVAPTSVAVLNDFIETPAAPNISNASWVIDSGRICLALPTSPMNQALLEAAAFRVRTASGMATVTTTCGTVTMASRTFLSVGI